jgi:hypothetical protein
MTTLGYLVEAVVNRSDGDNRKGILYQRIGQRDLALECFIQSTRANQFNWSCWLSIAACVSSTTEVGQPIRSDIIQTTQNS